MITLKTIDNKQTVKEYFQKENLTFNENSNCLCAKDGQEVLGYCLFDIDSKSITIRAISPEDDIYLCDGILRSSLHVACERGITEAFYSDKALEKIFKLLNFIKDENQKSLNIEKLFESCCGCK